MATCKSYYTTAKRIYYTMGGDQRWYLLTSPSMKSGSSVSSTSFGALLDSMKLLISYMKKYLCMYVNAREVFIPTLHAHAL